MSIAGWYSSAVSLLWKLPLPGESYPVHLALLGSVIIPQLVQMRVSGPGPWLTWTTLKGHLSFTVLTVILYLSILFLPPSLHRNCSNGHPLINFLNAHLSESASQGIQLGISIQNWQHLYTHTHTRTCTICFSTIKILSEKFNAYLEKNLCINERASLVCGGKKAKLWLDNCD